MRVLVNFCYTTCVHVLAMWPKGTGVLVHVLAMWPKGTGVHVHVLAMWPKGSGVHVHVLAMWPKGTVYMYMYWLCGLRVLLAMWPKGSGSCIVAFILVTFEHRN